MSDAELLVTLKRLAANERDATAQLVKCVRGGAAVGARRGRSPSGSRSLRQFAFDSVQDLETIAGLAAVDTEAPAP
jgi:hypothetical protein